MGKSDENEGVQITALDVEKEKEKEKKEWKKQLHFSSCTDEK